MSDYPRVPFYELIENLGQRSLTTTYRARGLGTNRLAVVKLFQSPRREAFYSFLQELRTLIHISHPHIIDLQAFGLTLDSHDPFLVFDHVDGADLASATHSLSSSHLYEVASQLCSAVHHLHEIGTAHGDLTPSNILVTITTDGLPHVTLIDFNSAPPSVDTQLSASPITAQYVAPERILGSPPSPATDIYSLGILLIELLTGSPLYDGSSVGDILQKHLTSDSVLLPESIPVSLRKLFVRMLDKSPRTRLSRVTEVLAAMTELTDTARRRHLSLSSYLLPTITLESHVATPHSGKTQLGADSFLITSNEDALLRTMRRVISYRILALGLPAYELPLLDEHSLSRSLDLLGQQRFTQLTLSFDLSNLSLLRPMVYALRAMPFPVAIVPSVNTRRSPDTAIRASASLNSLGLDCTHLPFVRYTEDQVGTALAHLPTVKFSSTTLHTMTAGDPYILSTLTARALASRPDSIALMADVQRDLQSLDAMGLQLCKLAALARTVIPASCFARCLNISNIQAEQSISALVQLGYFLADASGRAYCLSPLLQTAVANVMSRLEYERYHYSLAQWLTNERYGRDSDERIAHHLIGCGKGAESTRYAITAARVARRRGDYVAASRCILLVLSHVRSRYRHALMTLALSDLSAKAGFLDDAWTVLSTMEEATLSRRVCVSLLLHKSHCKSLMGDMPASATFAARALDASRLVAADMVAVAEWRLGHARCFMGDVLTARLRLLGASVDARKSGNTLLVCRCMADLAYIYWNNGQYRRALQYQKRALRLMSQRGEVPTRADALMKCAQLHTDLGHFTIALRLHHQVIALARRNNLQGLLGLCHNNLGEVFRILGRWRTALSFYRSAHHGLASAGSTGMSQVSRGNVSLALCRTGYYSDAIDNLAGSLSHATSQSLSVAKDNYLRTWAWLLHATGRYATATRVALKGMAYCESIGHSSSILEFAAILALCSEKSGNGSGKLRAFIDSIGTRASQDVYMLATLSYLQQRTREQALSVEDDALLNKMLDTSCTKRMLWHRCWGLLLSGERLLMANRPDQAEAALSEALSLASKRAERPFMWHAHYWLGRVYEHTLQYERALTQYRAAFLTINELAMDISDARYRLPFLAQILVGDTLRRYERLNGDVSKRARHNLAAMSRSERVSRRMLDAVNVIGQKLSSILDLNDLLSEIIDLSIVNVRAERGIVFLADDATGEMRLVCARGMDRQALESVDTFSRSVVARVATGQTLLTVDVGKDASLSIHKSLLLHQIKSILCVPMRSRGKTVGVIYLDTQKGTQLFTDKERTFVESFASQAAIAIENARLFGSMASENAHLKREAEGRYRFENLLGSSPPMKKLADTIHGVLNSDCNVLIVGESGTGKEMVARAVHYNGPRRDRKFVAIDCGALPENLLEAELFGFVRGAFTGADKDRVGLIEEARGGTLFLDEIANTSLQLQSRLLRVLQEREVRRVGENVARAIDVRVMAATNASLSDLMAQGKFRQDLYYRINVVTIEVPPLRDRRGDVPVLVSHFLFKHLGGSKGTKTCGPGVIEALMNYNWPGNVRELSNVIERISVLAGPVVALADLPDSLRPASVSMLPGTNGHPQKTGEQIMIEQALRQFGGDKAKAARYIGWNRQKLYRRMRAFTIPADYGQAERDTM